MGIWLEDNLYVEVVEIPKLDCLETFALRGNMKLTSILMNTSMNVDYLGIKRNKYLCTDFMEQFPLLVERNCGIFV